MRSEVIVGFGLFSLWATLLGILSYWSGWYRYGSFQDGLGNHQNKVRHSVFTEEGRPFWFLQVSDLHINEYDTHGGRLHFLRFLDEVIPRVNPKFVIVTGDITDAKSSSGLTSGQHEKEWQWYAEQLKLRQIDERKDYWFDLRGNHDGFNVPNQEYDFFAKYSVQKISSYAHHFPAESLSLISIDGCPSYGLPRPYNFFSSLNREKMDQLEQHINESQRIGIKHRILIGHYPTVTLQAERTSSGLSFAQLTENVSAYLTGHLHQLLLGLGKVIKAVQSNGLWDLEVGDLKEHKFYRIGIVDHGLLSFHDATLDTDTIICITSPPDSRLQLTQTVHHNQIRVLVFSSEQIKQVTASTGTDHLYSLTQHEDSNLWTAPSPALTESILKVRVTSKTGKINHLSQPFSSEKLTMFSSFGEFLLLFNFRRMIIWSTMTLLLLSMCSILFVMIHIRRKCSQDQRWLVKLRESIHLDQNILQKRAWFKKMAYHALVFGEDSNLRVALLAILAYIPLGPWFFGPLAADNSFGAVFLVGVLNRRSWTIILDTWFYGLLHLVQFILPGILLMVLYSSGHNFAVEPKSPRARSIESVEVALPWFHQKPSYLIIIFWYLLNVAKISLMMTNYGLISSLCSPIFTWYTAWYGWRLLCMIKASRMSQSQIPLKQH